MSPLISHSTPISLFSFTDTPTPEIYTLSLHDALPICHGGIGIGLVLAKELVLLHGGAITTKSAPGKNTTFAIELKKGRDRSEEHTSELQSQSNLVCRLLLEKKKQKPQPKKNARKTTQQ